MGAKVRFMGEEGMQKWFVIYHHIWGFFSWCVYFKIYLRHVYFTTYKGNRMKTIIFHPHLAATMYCS